MATEKLQDLRLKYRAAYTEYMKCVRALAASSEREEWPSDTQIRVEEKVFSELSFTRRALMDALYDHTHGGQTAA
jgi:hypothetical protein